MLSRFIQFSSAHCCCAFFCRSLRSLDLFDNELSGPIPASLGNLRHLELLQLQANHLSGTIPVDLTQNFTRLRVLNIAFNEQLSGSLRLRDPPTGLDFAAGGTAVRRTEV